MTIIDRASIDKVALWNRSCDLWRTVCFASAITDFFSHPPTHRFQIFCLLANQKTFYACTFCFPISDHVMPSWEFAFCFFISYACICTCIRRHLKETIPSSSITWSEMRKQNIQAKEVYRPVRLNLSFKGSLSAKFLLW